MSNILGDDNINLYFLKHVLYQGKRKKQEIKKIDKEDGNAYSKKEFVEYHTNRSIGLRWMQTFETPSTSYDKKLKDVLHSKSIEISDEGGITINLSQEERDKYTFDDDEVIPVHPKEMNFKPDLEHAKSVALKKWNEASSEFTGCFCGKEDFKDEWVQCDSCERWCHLSCAGFSSKEDANESDSYVCPTCASAD